MDEMGITHFGEFSIDSYHEQIQVDCNRCHACLARRKRDWAVRCVHEAEDNRRSVQLAEGPAAAVSNSCFITLTYAEEHLPDDESLKIEHWQKFMSNLRNSRRGTSLRYLACGEYGDKGRPHYHALLFGVSFHKDRENLNRDRSAAFFSEELEALWGKGRTELGPASYATAAYVAGYVVKKAYDQADILRPHDRPAYTLVQNKTNNTWREVKPEFNTSSRRPPLALPWIERNLDLVYSTDTVHIDGKQFRPPKLYDKTLRERRPDHWETIQAQRRAHTEALGLTTGLERKARKSLFRSGPQRNTKLK